VIVVKCWENVRFSSEQLGIRLFVASSLEEAKEIVKEWESLSLSNEGFERHAVILQVVGNELVPASYEVSQEMAEAIERDEWEW